MTFIFTKKYFFRSWVATAFLLATSGLQAANKSCEIKSSASGATLIELFTSEGCSSCPPAEAWQNNLKKRSDLWTRVVPVSFHVDYWDYLGWRDNLAHPSYARRQRAYQVKGHSRSVYTPGFFVNGREWRGFFGSRKFVTRNPVAQGKLAVSVNTGGVDVTYSKHPHGNKSLVLNVVLLGFDIAHQVRSGENSGRTLKHDFVVLHHMQIPGAGNKAWNVPLKLNAKYRGHKAGAIVTWVSTTQDPRPVQVAAGWLNKACL